MSAAPGIPSLSTDLAIRSAVPAPPADELATRFPLSGSPASPHEASELEQRRLATLAHPAFGTAFSAHMAHARWTREHGWSGHEVVPFGDITLSPAAAVLHYGQEVFEGIKAYRRGDGSFWTFRPRFNAARLNASARRLALPELPEEDFIASLAALVREDRDWVPGGEGESLYMRPYMIASEAFLGVHAASTVDYRVIASPSGSYFPHGLEPISIWVSAEHHRAGRGGTGAAKTGGNYASSLLPQHEAADHGCDQVLFLDDVTRTHVEECGSMNLLVVGADGDVRTPPLSGTILEGSTRGAILRLLADEGRHVSEEEIRLDVLLDGLRTGSVTEVLACGTAAVVVPLGRLAGEGFDVAIPGHDTALHVHDRLTGIQEGRYEDPYGWMYRLA